MSLPVTFGALPSPSEQPTTLFDENFAAVGALTVIACACATSGNAITLTPNANAPTVNAYGVLQLFSFVAAASLSGSATLRVGNLAAKVLLDASGEVAPGIAEGTIYIVSYSPTAQAGNGAFCVITGASSGGGSGSVRVVTAGGPIAIVADDDVVVINRTAPEAGDINLPAVTAKKGPVTLKDGAGNAATYNLTVTPVAGDAIDGQSSVVLNSNYQALTLTPVSGLGWIVT